MFLISITTLLFTFSLGNLFEDFRHGSILENRAGMITAAQVTKSIREEVLSIDNIRGVQVQRLDSPFLESITIRLNAQPFFGSINARIHAFDLNSPSIPTNFEMLFQSTHGVNAIKYGEDIQNEREMLVSERVFNLYGISNPQMFIGSYITVQGTRRVFNFETGTYDFMFTSISYRLVGILDSRLDSILQGHYFITKANLLSDAMVLIEVCFESFDGVEHSLESLFVLFPDVYLNAMWWYYGFGILYDMRFIERVQGFIQSFLLMLIVVIVVMFFASTIFNQYFLLKKNKSFYGVLKAKGMTNSRLTIMYFIEIFVILLLSQLISFGLSFGFIGVLNIPFYQFFRFTFLFTPWKIILTLLLATFATIFFAVIITSVIYFAIFKKEAVRLLRGNN